MPRKAIPPLLSQIEKFLEKCDGCEIRDIDRIILRFDKEKVEKLELQRICEEYGFTDFLVETLIDQRIIMIPGTPKNITQVRYLLGYHMGYFYPEELPGFQEIYIDRAQTIDPWEM